jgi:hypothetical protein
MSKSRFPLYLSEDEHRAIRIAAAHSGETMTDYIRVAVVERLTREGTPPRSAPAEPPAPHQKDRMNG